MKINPAKPSRSRRGMMLIEVIAYMAMFFVITGLAYDALYRCWTASAEFRRNSEEAARALQAGEQWRADVRAATGPIEASSMHDGQTVRIPGAGGEIVYDWRGERLSRSDARGRAEVVLSRIKSSRMADELKPFGAVWRWDLELTAKPKWRTRPLFSFAAVAPQEETHAH